MQDEYQNPSFLEQIRVQRLLEEAKMQVRLTKKETQKSRLSDVKPPRKPSDQLVKEVSPARVVNEEMVRAAKTRNRFRHIIAESAMSALENCGSSYSEKHKGSNLQ